MRVIGGHAHAEAALELVHVFEPLRAHALLAGRDTHGRTPAHVAEAVTQEPHVLAFSGAWHYACDCGACARKYSHKTIYK